MADSKKPRAHVAQYKKDVVKRIAQLIKKYPIIGCLNMENLPASQLQVMRAKLRGKVEILMTKRRLIRFAIDAVKGEKAGIEKIEPYLVGMPALLFTEENPFSLFKNLKKNKSKAPAKAGQIAPDDIIVPKGPTPFAPGPVIGELSTLGIKSKVDAGKIAIVEDMVACKKGNALSAPLAAMLARLGIMPMEIGLDLVAVYEKGDIFKKEILDIDEKKFMEDLSRSAMAAFNLSLESGYITELTREAMIQKAFRGAKAVALEAAFMADAVVGDLLARAEMQAGALTAEIPPLPESAPEPAAEAKSISKETDEKVAEMVHKTKQHAEGKEPTAEKLVEEAKEPAKESKKDEAGMKEVEALASKLVKKGTLRK